MKNDFQRHKRSDSVKWAITGIAIILIIAFLAGVIVAVVTETNPKDWGQIIKDSLNDDKNPGGIVDGDGNVMDDQDEVYAMPAAMAFSANALSDGSENTSVTLKCTFTPDTATNKNVNWSVAWKNPSSEWANGKTASDYVSVTPSSDSAVATVTCAEDFGEQIIITATSEDNSAVSKTCTVDYKKQIIGFNGITFKNFSGDMEYTLFNNSYTFISPTSSDSDSFVPCEEELNKISEYENYTDYLVEEVLNSEKLFKVSDGTLAAELPNAMGVSIALSDRLANWLLDIGVDWSQNDYYFDEGFILIHYDNILEFVACVQLIYEANEFISLVNSLQGIFALIEGGSLSSGNFAVNTNDLIQNGDLFPLLKSYEENIFDMVFSSGSEDLQTYEDVVNAIETTYSDEDVLYENLALDSINSGCFDMILQLEFDDGSTYSSGIILDFYNMEVPVEDMDINQGSIIF